GEAASATAAAAPLPLDPAPLTWHHVPAGIAVLYICVCVVLLGRWLLGHLGVWRLLQNAGPAPAPVAGLFEQMVRDRNAASRRPRLLVSPRLQVPVSCGLFRPAVILPASLCEEEARSVLPWVFAHELTHLERRDGWTCLLFSLAQAFYFYVPWFWWLRRQVRLCQEYVADAAAVRTSHAEDYAQFLLNLTAA